MRNQVTLQQLQAAKRSIKGRQKRLRKIRTGFNRHTGRFDPDRPSPIEAIGVFPDEIDAMERALNKMERRLNNARITIEIDD